MALFACSASLQAKVNTAANALLPELSDAYRREESQCVQYATTRPEAEACIAAAEIRWKAIWLAWDALRVSSDPVVSWCKFSAALESDGLVVPQIPGVPCS